MCEIFVTYRREDMPGYSGRLIDHLRRHFGKGATFRDVGSIPPGEKFEKAIFSAIASSHVVLAIIGPNWLVRNKVTGERRIAEEGDWVRRELEKALERKVPVIPLLVEGAKMPAAEDLPPVLKEFAGYQAIELSDTRWDYDVAQLLKAIAAILGSRRVRFTPKEIVAAVMIVAALLLAAKLWLDRDNAVQPPIVPGSD
jgi:hypothetical protein